MNFFKLMLSVTVILLSPFSALAEQGQKIPGGTDPAFLSAVNQWLDGRDLAALQALSALAHDNNRAAQILLGRIAIDPILYAHATMDMSQRERISLLRPGRLSATTWLKNASEEVPLAKAFLANYKSENLLDAATVLFAHGEIIEFMKVVDQMTTEDSVKVLQRVESPRQYEGMLLLKMFTAQNFRSNENGPHGSLQRVMFDLAFRNYSPEIAIETLAWSPMSLAVLEPFVPQASLQDRIDFAETYTPKAKSYLPIRNLCERQCPETVASCTAVAASQIIGSTGFPFSSPVESLISNEEYWSSRRMDLDVVRRTSIRPVKDHPQMHVCISNAYEKLEKEAFGNPG